MNFSAEHRLCEVHLLKSLRMLSHPKDTSLGVVYDQSIMLNNHSASKDYPEKMRRIKFKDDATGKMLIFLTNNFHFKATEIAQL